MGVNPHSAAALQIPTWQVWLPQTLPIAESTQTPAASQVPPPQMPGAAAQASPTRTAATQVPEALQVPEAAWHASLTKGLQAAPGGAF